MDEIDIQIPTTEVSKQEIYDHSIAFSYGSISIQEQINALREFGYLEEDVYPGVYNIFDLIKTCSSRTRFHPAWGILAGRILNQEINKTTGGSFSASTKLLKKLCNKEYYDFVQENKEILDSFIDETRSDEFQSIAVATCLKSFLWRYNTCGTCGKCEECDKLWVGETIQEMYLRCATFIFMDTKNPESSFQKIKDMYDFLSLGFFACASPQLFNAGGIRHQMASCFVTTIKDSLHSIEDYWTAVGEISRTAGGLGIDVGRIRHSLIGFVGKSDGIPALLPTYEAILRYVDQSKKRKGSAAIYTPVWHTDIETVIKMKDPNGADSDNSKCLDLNYAVWTNNLFWKRCRDREQWSLFCPAKCPELTELWGEEFEKKYIEYEQAGRAIKVIDAQGLLEEIINAQTMTGMPYLSNMDVINQCNMQDNFGIVRSSNLCVSGDTKILTDKGYYAIETLEDEKVNVWNGEEFSSTTVRKTGENQDMVQVSFSNGSILKCTPYHKFYIQIKDPYTNQKNILGNENYVKIIEAKDLKKGMKLFKIEYPVLDDNGRKFPYAYTHGVFCGDGTYEQARDDNDTCNKKALTDSAFCGRHTYHEQYYNLEPQKICQAKLGNIPRVSLYGEKKKLIEHLDYVRIRDENTIEKRVDIVLPLDLPKKYKVPINYRIKDKLRWFAGICDTDGVLVKNGDSQSIQLSSIDLNFLNEIKYMLQTLGCDPKIGVMHKAAKRLLPDNKGKGEYKEYNCKTSYRLLLGAMELYDLMCLGFKTYRLKIIKRKPQRGAKHYIQIQDIEILDEKMDTFCFNEKKRHMGIFNGIVSSQCNEICLNTSDTAIASCNLSSVCLPRFIQNKVFDWKQFERVVRLIVRMMDNVIERNYYPDRETELYKKNYERILALTNDPVLSKRIVDEYETKEVLPFIRKTNLDNRPLGIGLQGFGDAVAKMDWLFDSEEAADFNNQVIQHLYYYAVDESANIAQELGSYKNFPGSSYSKGILHPDKWSSPKGEKAEFINTLDWEALRQKVMKGMRHSTLLALMPTATSSIIAGNSPSLEPINCMIGTKTILSGQHVVLSKELFNDMNKLGVWTPRLVQEILDENKDKYADEDGVKGVGGIQHLGIPPEIENHALKRIRFKNLITKYRTAYEIEPKVIIDHAAVRTPFVCQSQSTNLWISNPTVIKSKKMYMYAYNKGLKTLVYYCRGTSSVSARQIGSACRGDSCSG